MTEAKSAHLRLDPEIHDWLKRRVNLKRSSINAEISQILRDAYRNDSLLSVRLSFNPQTRLYTIMGANSDEPFREFSHEAAARAWISQAGISDNQIICETEEVA